MKLKSRTNETVIANALVAILERLDMLEKATSLLSGQHLAMLKAVPVSAAPNVEQAILLQKLEKLTLKRHAVLTATLGGQSYQAIANAMGCDLTTVKLHLKAALEVLGIRNRSFLLVSWPNVLDFISDMEYEARYGVSKRWWLENKPELMVVLRACKPANNQHTK